MFTKAQNKYIRSLTQQKYRKEYNVFVAEGVKIVNEWLNTDADIQMIVATADWAGANQALIDRHPAASLSIIDERELEALSSLKTANQVLLVAGRPEIYDGSGIEKEWCIALDHISDPGNMGTIIRIADWFGIKHVVCSPQCVDVYNPKVIQSAMGSHLRVKIHSCELADFISGTDLPVLAATLNGDDVYRISAPDAGILLIGNESFGVSQNLLNMATTKVTIPSSGGAESLNAAVSTGILCALLVGGRN